MVREFKLPDVGEGVAEGELVEWHVEVGDTVTEDQVVAEVETDKAVVDVPSPVNGTVRELRAEPGEVVPVGDVIITFDVEGEPVEPDESAAAEGGSTAGDAAAASGESANAESDPSTDGESAKGGRVFAAPSARKLARELGVEITSVQGSGPGGRITERDVRMAAEGGDGATAGDDGATAGDDGTTAGADDTAAEAGDDGELQSAVTEIEDDDAAAGGASGGASAGGSAGTATVGGPEPADRERTLAAPATRKTAQELDVDIDDVPATEQRDGEAFVDEQAVRQYAEAQQAAQEEAALAVAEETGEDVTREEYKGIRRTIGEAMAESKYTAPHVTHHDTVVVDDLVEARSDLKAVAEERGYKLTYMPFVLKAMVAALEEFPILNAELDEAAGEIVKKHYYNVGVAVATDAGLMVPVVEDVDDKGMLELSGEINELAGRARDRTISREEMQGSTITVTNFGAFGGEYATPIINHPEVAIIGLGELKQRPVVEDGEVEAAYTLPISIAIDHRIIDGAEVAQFCNTMMEYLENPQLLLLE